MQQPVQMLLFDKPTFNISRDLKETMNAAAKQCPLSRAQITDRMNKLAVRYGVALGKGNRNGLSLETLEKWLNPYDKTRQIPIKALPIFCAVVGDHKLLEVLANPLGIQIIGEDDQRLLKWAKAYHIARKARKTMRKYDPDV